MKMSPEHYEILKDACVKVIKARPTAMAQYRGQGLSEKRFRWDVLWAAQAQNFLPTRYWITEVLYPAGLNDTHIDTALRRIIAELPVSATS